MSIGLEYLDYILSLCEYLILKVDFMPEHTSLLKASPTATVKSKLSVLHGVILCVIHTNF